LEYASLQLERDEISDDPQYAQWLQMLIAPGSSLGGARPKANVIDNYGNLWIAKFPSRNDNKDVGAWEEVTNILAKNCGIKTPESDMRCFLNKQHTYLSKRFDRNNDGSRIHFASAMTLLGLTDGADHTDGVSYLALVEFLLMHGYEPDNNLEQLWRRIVFNIAVSNCDDHLRNHGFLLTPGGWVLSPAYDMNPDENGTGLRLNINEDDNSLDFDLAMSVISYFRLSENKALQMLKEVKQSVSQWRQVADQCHIPHSQQEWMSTAFHF
jgi:serine/threonine-protein kinase HipA